MKPSFCIRGSFFTLCLLVLILACNRSEEHKPGFDQKSLYAGAEACKSCHAEAYTDWTKSDHFLAMQPANDSTVLGDFNNITFSADGVTSIFFKKDGKYFINTQGEDGLNHDYEVLYTFGYFPLQQYLIAFPGGRLQSTRVSWDARDKKWFHQYAGQTVYHRDWLHWTGNSQNWNTMCASCHSTDLRKNYDFTTDTYKTTWNEINVSCESCHGPGSKHIAFINSKQHKKGKRIENAGLFYGRDTIAQLQLNACAACHARKSDVAQEVLRTNEILDDLIPQVITDDLYFADGQIKEEDYEYGSFTQSKMYHHNVRCTSCHNPHSGHLRLEGNSLCLSCHKPEYNTKAHHFHEPETEAAQCINCHMVARTYMGVDHRRDHSFRLPRPDQSVQYGTPNACNQCHTDQKAAWAAGAINTWYGPVRTYHFSDDLIPGSLFDEKSEAHLVNLVSDTTQPEIARATAVHYLGSLQTMGSGQILIKALSDKKALVRYHALRSLENFPPDLWQGKAYLALSDKVRAVRIAAADLYHRLPAELVPVEYKESFAAAERENMLFLQNQLDFAVGNVMMGDYKMQGGQTTQAITYYVRGLDKDSLMNYARLNLAAAYNRSGQNEEALNALLDAAAIDPFNDQVFYNLGLLYYELGDIRGTLGNFEKAVHLGSNHPGLYYNFGIALQQEGNFKEAEKMLLKGHGITPQAPDLNYALAFFYIQQNRPQNAIKYAEVLKRMDPQNQEYQEIFRRLGL